MLKNPAVFLLLVLPFASFAQHIEILQQGQPTSIRGLSVVNDSVAWISGSKGHIAITTDGGRHWDWRQVMGFGKADFRAIEAFSAKDAIIMSSGAPALILKTTDGGANWQIKYRNTDTAYFLDAIAFSDKQTGYALGDPINSKFVLLETQTGGETWTNNNNCPAALTGEAAFAASGTCLNITPADSHIIIATGGNFAEVDIPKTNQGWNHHQIPIIKGKPSQGAFSIAVGRKQMVVVGGDYQNDKRADSIACYSADNGVTWNLATVPPEGFQSCVEYIKSETFISTGTPGSNLTTDGGKTWAKIDSNSYNVCRKAKRGNLVILAGNNGKIGIFKP